MQRRALHFLAGLALASVLFVLLVERHTETTDERLERSRKAFPDFAALRESVDRVEIIGDGTSIILDRTGEGDAQIWMIVKPIQWKADKWKVDSLLNRLVHAELINVKEDKVSIGSADRARLGLGPTPTRRLRVLCDGGKTLLHDVQIGNVTPDRAGFYLSRDGREIVVISRRELFEEVSQGQDAFRDRTVLERFEANRIEWWHEDRQIVVVREGDRWMLTRPLADRANPEKIKSILDRLFNLRVEKFPPADYLDGGSGVDLRKAGINPPKIRLTLQGTDGASQILLGGPVPDEKGLIYVTGRCLEPLMVVRTDLDEDLSSPIDAFRDDHLVRIDPDRVKKVDLRRGKRQILLEKSENIWKITRPLSGRADTEVVSGLLEDLAGARIEKYLPAGAKVDRTPGREVQVRLDSGGQDQPAETVTVGLPEGQAELVWALRAGNLFRVHRVLAQALAQEPVSFRNRQLLALNVMDLRAITLQDASGVREARRSDTGPAKGQWEGEQIDGGALDALAWRLASLRAERFVGPMSAERRAACGLDGPQTLTVRLKVAARSAEMESRTQTIALKVGHAASVKTYYAVLSTEPLVFCLGEDLVEALKRAGALPPPSEAAGRK